MMLFSTMLSVFSQRLHPQDNQQPSANNLPTSMGFVYRSRTVRFVLNLVQLYICGVVCVSVLQSGNRCLSTAILFRYECRMGVLFVLSCARV